MKLTQRYRQVLDKLSKINEIQSKDLSVALGIDPKRSTLAVLLHSMRRDGLVESPHPGIHRITRAGRNALAGKVDANIEAQSEDSQDQPTSEAIDNDQARPLNLDTLIAQVAERLAREIASQTLGHLQAILQPQTSGAAPKIDSIVSAVSVAVAEAANTTPSNPGRIEAASPEVIPVLAKPVVTIIGLLPGQASMISKEYGEHLHIKFADSSHLEPGRLRAICSSSYATVALLNFISHSQHDIAKMASTNFLPVKGGMSSVRLKLDEIVARINKGRLAA